MIEHRRFASPSSNLKKWNHSKRNDKIVQILTEKFVMKKILVFLTILVVAIIIATLFIKDRIAPTQRDILGETISQESERGQVIRFEPQKSSQDQLALVIGNDDYEFGPLTNPINDAIAISEILKEKDFKVILKKNLTFGKMGKAISEFGNDLTTNKGAGLFYFSGHGAQIKGENYLIPINNNRINDEIDVQDYAVPLSKIVRRMEQAKNGLNIIILDACRNNPFNWEISQRSLSKGLAKTGAADGILIAFATHPGATASDNKY
ncbi:MAG TPA: hypothetical protein EYP59_05030 [Thiotrichaceae bacterium]|nr:hypothetical protein [Thiotrichaceae bacterium]